MALIGTMQHFPDFVEKERLCPLLPEAIPLAELAAAQAEFITRIFIGSTTVHP